MNLSEAAVKMAHLYMASDHRSRVVIGFDQHGKPAYDHIDDVPSVVREVKPAGVVVTMWGVDDPYNEKEVVRAFLNKIEQA